MVDPSGLYEGSLPWMIATCSDALSAAGIIHGFGGALALAYATNEPRGTIDIDINIVADAAHPKGALRALPSAIRHTDADVAAIRRDGQVRLYWPREGRVAVPIDLFFPQHAFHAVVAGRIRRVEFATTTIPVISPTDIVIFKVLFNRTKDWADIEAVIAARSANFTEVARWLAQLLGPESRQLRRLLTLLKSAGVVINTEG